MKKMLLALTLVVGSSTIKAAPNKNTATLTIQSPCETIITFALHKRGDSIPEKYTFNKPYIDRNAKRDSIRAVYSIPLKTSLNMTSGKEEYETLIKIQTKDGIIREYSIEAQKGTFRQNNYPATIQPNGSLIIQENIIYTLSRTKKKDRKQLRPDFRPDIAIREIQNI